MAFPEGPAGYVGIIHFFLPFRKPFLRPSEENIVRGQVLERGMEAFRVVKPHPFAHLPLGVLCVEVGVPADLLRLERSVHALDLPVAQGVERRRRRLPQLELRDQPEKLPGRELFPVVVNDTRMGVGMQLLRADHENFRVHPLHGREQVPDEDAAAVPVEDAGEVVETPADADIREVRMPLLVRA